MVTTLTEPDNQIVRSPTMREVAALAGVSIKSVSRVVNQESGVSAALAERVSNALRLLHYQPNTAASSLRRTDQRTATVGLVLNDLANPFSSAIHRAIEDVARQHTSFVLAGSSDADPQREAEIARALVARRVDGLILIPTDNGITSLAQVKRFGRPLVFVDRLSTGLGADSVTSDNRSGAAAAVSHLIACGHRRIAFLGDVRTIWTAAERYVGYLETLATAGLRLDPALVCHDLAGSAAAERAANALLDSQNPPTALFTSQNLLTIGAVRALQLRGAQRRVALIGFDDVLLADLLDPPVTVIAQDPAAIGQRAAELLFSRIGLDQSDVRQIIVPTKLVVRGSGEIRPVE